ncbi:uncharacterized protein SCHCODRAFT_02625189 [Schizophyllum commune H4-8]|uniref:F-box domain-containing protein n=1 Tax=Schizophyllum commune (strain H4-8 / FGSC 9210) TaxID=578458 RepID=D8Q5R7_SCHCM|nr:uncharacterized protein SCHCODRAFT_02625189 [Schizophyllum commune H4-8]KAI5892064.1 hypothetical protein SCHCODRAFT_02625189 [Schizophyllum commune H4-8]
MSLDAKEYPVELLFAISAYVYAACLPPWECSLDPLLQTDCQFAPKALPSSHPSAYWSEPDSRRTLASLCLVNRAWYAAARPWLYHKLEVRMPRSWLSLVEQIAWDYEEETVDMVMDHTLQAAARVALASAHPGVPLDDDARLKLQQSILQTLDGPDESIPPELLSPAISREPSPRRIRPKSKSPARWQLIQSISDAIRDVFERREPNVYIPTPDDPRPGRFVHHLDFNHFRTIGLRRSVSEGVNSRFVTGDRVEAILKEMPNLMTFGATEYMDGALTGRVLNELFLRGAASQGRGRPMRGRALAIADPNDTEEDDRERRRECRELQAIDFTGCVSAVFINALTEFVERNMATDDDESGDDHQSRRGSSEDPLILPGLRRLNMRAIKPLSSRTLRLFVMACPSLTHLDLSATRVDPELLYELGRSTTVRLRSLALARCVRLTGESITDFLINSPVTSELTELNLYGDATFISPLSEDDMMRLVTQAPCMTRGELAYLDVSSTPMTAEHLAALRPQPKLRSLGFSHLSELPLPSISDFLANKAPNVEVLTLVGTSPELVYALRPSAPRGSVRTASIALHTHVIRPLCTPPFVSCLAGPADAPPPAPPTRLRVIELSTAMLTALGAGAGAWRIIRSKGGRGWYVDTASGWCDGVLVRDLEESHPMRAELQWLADAHGNVSSGVGWHARKMEVLQGYGMLGRENGMYGAVSFAFQG